MSSGKGNHALVLGASGLAGWGLTNQLLSNYPAKGTFTRVTACANRPLALKETMWPSPGPDVPVLDFVAGIDLTKGTLEGFAEEFNNKVQSLATVTHVYYFALKPEGDVNVEREVNAGMLERVLYAVEKFSDRLKFVVFPSGTRAYGLYNPAGILKAPFKESMIPPVEETFGGKLHYHAYADLLAAKSAGKSWTWCDVRPDAVVGFVPGGSAFNLTAHWGTYLALYALVEGKGAKVYFPGTEAGMSALYNDASSDTIGKLAIWASLNPDKTGGEIFNVADCAEPSSQRERWPRIAGYFGLEGVGPREGGAGGHILSPSEYMEKHKEVLVRKGVKASSVFYGAMLDANMGSFDKDRHFDLSKTKGVGFVEEVDPNQSWFDAFDKYRAAGMLPS